MASTYDIQHMFFKRQTGIENHTKQLDGFSEVNARPRDVYTTGLFEIVSVVIYSLGDLVTVVTLSVQLKHGVLVVAKFQLSRYSETGHNRPPPVISNLEYL